MSTASNIGAAHPARTVVSIEQARQALTAAAAASPNDPQPQVELALFDLKAGQAPEAVSRLAAAWKKFPRYPRAPYNLGMIELMQGSAERAVPPLRAAAALAPNDPQARANLANALFRAGADAEARKDAEAAIALDPQAPDAYLLMANILNHHGTALAALGYAQQYLARSPAPAQGEFLIGRIYASMSDGPQAAEWLKRALNDAPDSGEIWMTLGRVYFEMFRTTKADEGIRDIEKSVELSPQQSEPHLWLGRVRASQNRWEEAVTQFRQAMELTSEPGPIYYDLGKALIAAGLKDEGDRALAAYQSYRDYTEGLKRLSAAIAKDPHNRAARYDLARFCVQHHQLHAALNVLADAAHQLGPDAEINRLRAQVEAAIGTAAPPPARSAGQGATQ